MYFFSDEIEMDKQLQKYPLFSSYEYHRCYFLVHKVYSHFIGDINNKNEQSLLKNENLNKILDYLDQLYFGK